MSVGKLVLWLGIGIAVGGGFLSYWGYEEYQIGSKATVTPLEVDLAKLQPGSKVDNNHVKIGPHIACLYSTIYSYTAKEHDIAPPGPSVSVTYSYYPIVSISNEEAQQLEKTKQNFGPNFEKWPDHVRPTLPQNFVILVKTKRFKTIGEVDRLEVTRRESSLQGMVINEIAKPNKEEEGLIRKTFPSIDFNKVLIVEEGRTPLSAGLAFGALIGGVVLVLVGVVVAIVGILMLSRS